MNGANTRRLDNGVSALEVDLNHAAAVEAGDKALARLSAFQAARHKVSTNRFNKVAGISMISEPEPGHGEIRWGP